MTQPGPSRDRINLDILNDAVEQTLNHAQWAGETPTIYATLDLDVEISAEEP